MDFEDYLISWVLFSDWGKMVFSWILEVGKEGFIRGRATPRIVCSGWLEIGRGPRTITLSGGEMLMIRD